MDLAEKYKVLIIELLRKKRPLSIKEIARESGIRPDQLYVLIKQMLDDGLLVRAKRNNHKLPPAVKGPINGRQAVVTSREFNELKREIKNLKVDLAIIKRLILEITPD